MTRGLPGSSLLVLPRDLPDDLDQLGHEDLQAAQVAAEAGRVRVGLAGVECQRGTGDRALLAGFSLGVFVAAISAPSPVDTCVVGIQRNPSTVNLTSQNARCGKMTL